MLIKYLYNKERRHKILKGILCLFAIFSGGTIDFINAQSQDETKQDRIVLLPANKLDFDQAVSADYPVVRGGVRCL